MAPIRREIRFGLTDDVPDKRIGNELADFVLNGGAGFGHKPVRILGKLIGPKSLHHWIGNVFHHSVPVIFVR